MVKTTLAQDELFNLCMEHFVKAKPRHYRLIADFTESVLSRNKPDDLPGLTLRVRIIDFIWNHNCNCKCNGFREGCN